MYLWFIYPPFDIGHYILVFTFPAIIGGLLFYKASRHRFDIYIRNFYILAGIIVLKPMVATPIWYMISSPIISGSQDISSIAIQHTLILSILPGVVPTILLLIIFHSIFFTRRKIVPWLMVFFDCARWINGLIALIVLLARSLSNVGILMVLSALGNFMPSIFAIIIFGMLKKYESSVIRQAGKTADE